jgi:two-component system NarL family sensor kinase
MKNYLLLVLLSLPLFLFAQRPSLDSMLRVVETEPDTSRVKTYGLISFGYLRRKADSALFFGSQQRDLALELKDTVMLKNGVSHMALAYKYLGDYEASLKLELECLQWNRILDNDRGIAISLGAIATLYKRLKDYDQAREYYLESIAMREEMNDSLLMANAYNNFGILVDDMGEKEESLVYHFKALAIYEALGRASSVNLAYANTGASLMDLNRLEEAKVYVQRGLEGARKDGYKSYEHDALVNLGIIAEKQNQPLVALEYYQQGFTLAESIPLPNALVKLRHDQARALGKVGRYQEALALEQEAYFLQDSLFTAEKAEAIAELQTQFEVAEKDLEIARLNEKDALIQLENTRLWAGLGIAGTVILLLSLGLVLYRQRQKQGLEAQRQKAEKTQFRAVLDAEEQERSRIAGDLHDSLGQLLSTTKLQLSSLGQPLSEIDQPRLISAIDLLDESVTEVRQISHNLAPPALIRGDLPKAFRDLARLTNNTGQLSFDLQLNAPDLNLPKELEIHIYRIVQELINNSIKHAGCSELGLTLNQRGQMLAITVWDNGGGFDLTEVQKGKGGLGWHSIQGRLRLLDGSFEMESDLETGTKVSLLIPIN